jgi:hypothetical protein
MAIYPRDSLEDAFAILDNRDLWSDDKIHPNPNGHTELADVAQRHILGRLDPSLLNWGC